MTAQLPSIGELAAQVTQLLAIATEHTSWQNLHEDRHARLEAEVLRNTSNLAALQTPLQTLEGLVGQVAQDGSMVASTLVAHVHAIEQYVMLEGTGIRARLEGLDQRVNAAAPRITAPPGMAQGTDGTALEQRVAALENAM